MRYAHVQSGKVVNVSVASPEIAAGRGLILCPDNIGPGDLYNGTSFTKAPPLPPPPNPIDERFNNDPDLALVLDEIAKAAGTNLDAVKTAAKGRK